MNFTKPMKMMFEFSVFGLYLHYKSVGGYGGTRVVLCFLLFLFYCCLQNEQTYRTSVATRRYDILAASV